MTTMRVPASRIPATDNAPVLSHDGELDAREWRCPLPLLRAKQALRQLASGQVLRVLATDPGSVRDFEAWSRLPGGPSLLSFSTDGDTFVYLLQKGMA